MRQPRIPVAAVVREPRHPAESMGAGERAMLIVVALMFLALFSAAVILPHLPSTAAGW